MTTYHLVDYSPWPLLTTLSLVSLFISGPTMIGIIGLTLIQGQWFRDCRRESLSGHHTKKVQKGIFIGFLLFQISEIMIFFSLFWAYFHSALVTSNGIYNSWPPLGIESVDYLSIPLLGSIVLLSSGFFVTLSHHAFLNGNKKLTIEFGVLTIILGIIFTILQLTEYIYGTFTIADSVYGTVFYMTTGLHGIHVLAGTIFLLIQYIRIYYEDLTLEHHLAFEFSIIYWHLVDVIWLGVYLVYYWFGS